METPVITIYVRHSADCKYKGDESYRRCHCRKHLRWTLGGKQYRRKAGTRSWGDAEQVKADLFAQLTGRKPDTVAAEMLIEDAVRLFVEDKQAQGVTAGVAGRYQTELSRLLDYCTGQRVLTVKGITREVLTGYASTWEKTYASSNTRAGVRERLRSFLRYCYEAQWLERIPAVTRVIADEAPTMPLTDEEYGRVLAAVDVARPMRFEERSNSRLLEPDTKARLRALIQLMRWSGLAIQDAVKLRRSDIAKTGSVYRVVTARQKTGTHVSVPIPPDVAREILAVPMVGKEHIFWTGESAGRTAPSMWGSRYMRAVFEAAGVRSGHMVSHRLRDTFAVDLLQKGVPLPDVSKALGHESIKTTEKHYAKWVKGRQDRLDSLVMGTWAASKPGKRRNTKR